MQFDFGISYLHTYHIIPKIPTRRADIGVFESVYLFFSLSMRRRCCMGLTIPLVGSMHIRFVVSFAVSWFWHSGYSGTP